MGEEMLALSEIKELLASVKVSVLTLSVRPFIFRLNTLIPFTYQSDDYIIVRLKHEAHLLEKCVKNEYSNRGDKRFRDVKKLLSEVERRLIDESRVIEWATKILIVYKKWTVEKKKQIEVVTIDSSETVSFTQDKIFDVKSTRFFESKVPSIDLIKSCISAAQLASASCNRQAFRIGIIKNTGQLVVGEANNASLFEKAPYRIFIFSNKRNYSEKYADSIDVGMFAQNFVLKANLLGLSSCCCYAAEHLDLSQQSYRELFDLSKGYYCLLSIVVGFPLELAVKPPRRNLENIINIIER